MMQATFIIYGRLPGINEIIAAGNAHKQAGAALKRETEKFITFEVKTNYPGPLPQFDSKVQVFFDFYEPNETRDPDNISGGAHKFILDTLARLKVIPGDARRHLEMPHPYLDAHYVDKDNPRIEITVVGRG